MMIEVNGRAVEARPNEMLLTALRRSGIRVPTLCSMEGLTPSGACRLCVVEVEGEPRLVPSCACPVAAGMRVRTHSPRAVNARRTIVELLLSNHPDDCLYCARNADCDLRSLAAELGIRQRSGSHVRRSRGIDVSSPSLARDPDKCILCGRCVRVCEEIQGVCAIDFIGRGSETRIGPAFGRGMNVSSCLKCGQCILACPTGALAEHNDLDRVLEALNDPARTVVVQHAPAVSVTLGETFGLKTGTDVQGALTAALRRAGFARVFDTAYGADLAVLEQASELAHRITNGGPLPMMTSCSPAWVQFVEEFHPELIPNLSTCKSPQQMLGALLKTRWAEQAGIATESLYSVAVTSCTAGKFEAQRPEMRRDGRPDVDAVLTTRELAQLLRERGLDLGGIAAERNDAPFGERSTAGKLAAGTGGMMEAVLRTAHLLLVGGEMQSPTVQAARGLAGVKEFSLQMGDRHVSTAVASGLLNARKLLDEVRAGKRTHDFIEVAACPGGCINGGGQPRRNGANGDTLRLRLQALYNIDRDGAVRTSHSNASVQALYREFLGEPLGERSRRLLHTTWSGREALR